MNGEGRGEAEEDRCWRRELEREDDSRRKGRRIPSLNPAEEREGGQVVRECVRHTNYEAVQGKRHSTKFKLTPLRFVPLAAHFLHKPFHLQVEELRTETCSRVPSPEASVERKELQQLLEEPLSSVLALPV